MTRGASACLPRRARARRALREGKANRAEARQSDPGCAGGFAEARGGFLATAKFHFDTPQLAAGSFILCKLNKQIENS